MRCPHCRGEIPPESQFCGVCGQNIAVAERALHGPATWGSGGGESSTSASLFDLPVSKGARVVRTAMILGLNLLLFGGGLALTLEYLHKRERSARGVLAGTQGSEDARAVGGQGEPLTELLIDAGTGRHTSPLDGGPSREADRQAGGDQEQDRNTPGTPAASTGRADSGPTNSAPTRTDSTRGTAPPPARTRDAGLSSPPRELVDAGGGGSATSPEEEARRVNVLAAQISLVVERHQGQLKRCYESASKVTTPDQPIQGRIDVRFAVQADGSAQSVRTSRNDTGSAALENCLLALVRSWTFPASQGEALDFVWPFEFQAPK